ncbi:hypothetical protein [Streptomyces sp. NBC_00055]|uniref:hypothetical protein n=1 Tax=unclassified Streptomyces TaxID=2593676 RepID=UPI002F909BEA
MESEAQGGAYSYTAKRVADGAHYFCPARLDPSVIDYLQHQTVAAHEALGGHRYSRHDFMVSEEGVTIWLEVNTLPGLTHVGNLVRMAEADGITYGKLISHIVQSADAAEAGGSRHGAQQSGSSARSRHAAN